MLIINVLKNRFKEEITVQNSTMSLFCASTLCVSDWDGNMVGINGRRHWVIC